PTLDEIVLRAVGRDPASRFPTAEDMASALEGAVAPATAREVGAWVAEEAGSSLDERSRLVAAVNAFDARTPTEGDDVGPTPRGKWRRADDRPLAPLAPNPPKDPDGRTSSAAPPHTPRP